MTNPIYPPANTTWVYLDLHEEGEHGEAYHIYTVGFYDPAGKWHAESDHSDADAAAERVHWLNGGNSK